MSESFFRLPQSWKLPTNGVWRKVAGLVVSSLKRWFLVLSLRTFYFFSSRDLKCGKLFCAGGQRSPLLGESKVYSLTNQKQNVTIKCKTMFLNHNSRDMGLVNAGTKCGDGMVRGQRLANSMAAGIDSRWVSMWGNRGKQWPRFLLLIEGEGSDNMVILFLLNCSYPKLYVIGISVLNWYLKIGI